ncbi:MAG: sigma-70 family RNA polymerase sigma factor [Planctomycetes bacterium]|nr:sigma-70 family RNA polymerase sigma factor [Planctomycetota bacterium]
MATSRTNVVLEHLRRSVLLPGAEGLTDRQLLESFLSHREEAAFEVIVRRHGPMVMGVCRRVLRNRHDAEDAFQATFLVLVRKAASIASRELLANWLYGVAYNTARRAKAAAARRRVRERQVTQMPEPEAVEECHGTDLQPLLDQELSRLPDRFRIPIVLCYLEGKTRREVARQLGWPEGTVAGRLARARAMLARRLARHGLVLSGGSLAVLLSQESAACALPSVAPATIKAATLLAAGEAVATGAIPANVLALTKGVLRAMLMSKLPIATVVLSVLACVGLGIGGHAFRTQAAEETGSRNDTGLAAQQEATAQPEGGKPVNGLVASAVVVEKPARGSTAFELRFRLKNVSGKPITVCDYLGHQPLKVLWTGPDGKRLKSKHYDCLAHAKLVALRKDNFAVIPPGGMRLIRPEILFYPPTTKEPFAELLNIAQVGKHRVTVSFTNNQDGKEFGLRDVWTGTVVANEVTFSVKEAGIIGNAPPEKDGTAKGLKLTLSADRTETTLRPDGSDAAPVKLRLTFTNVSDRPVRLNVTDRAIKPSTHSVQYRVRFRCTGPGPGSVEALVEEIKRPPLPPPAAVDFPVLQPGKSWSPAWAIAFPGELMEGPFRGVLYRLRKPGTYKLRCTHEDLESNELELTVKRP